ncbi:hypothetical protein DENSPDRAFT_857377 [Dentipellis sp. KUC8613]|nr:hypothetical protein DENSPDRAFT_857377 [Dentipellis sp. KUC8613]
MSEAGPSTRPVTPPPRNNYNADTQLTPEQVKRVEINRLKAKARQREREASASSSSIPNGNNKRPLAVVSAASTSPTGPTRQEPKLKRDSRLGKYFEYDLSKMVNSKGGFLVEDKKEAEEDLKTKARERERQKAMQNLDPPIYLDPRQNPKCIECGSVDIDQTYRKIFRCLVCNRCKNEKPEKYSLLTKTECKEDYLLTDSAELRDEELLPHLLKANPHKSTFANMMLFCRYQVEAFAWQKWGSPEALDAEWEKRTEEKKKKKNKKFEQSLKELRKRTREGVWQKRKDAEHKHVFSQPSHQEGGVAKQVCHECGFTIETMADSADPDQAEHRHISTSLEVEQLDDNLYRSRELWLPFRARGVFGGQVISQAIVSATKCVQPQYALHCYFLLSASSAVPILYYVDKLREGRSYTTIAVKAVQRGRTIFMMISSFHIPEPLQLSHQWAMPNVPSPEDCPNEEDIIRSAADDGRDDATRKSFPIVVKRIGNHIGENGTPVFMFWMRPRDKADYDMPFQKAILGYISDTHFLPVAANTLRISRFGGGVKPFGMIVSEPTHDFDCNDWILYMTVSSVASSGRGFVTGRMYSRSGTLIAITNQEGVVRADIRDAGSTEGPKSKM